ncbi:MAG: hypothetical protein ACR2JB_07965 [Bryobacteraceae bacterium]
MREIAARSASLYAVWTAALLIITSMVMMIAAKDYPPRVLPAGIRPTLAMELPESKKDISNILGGPNDMDPARAVSIMRDLQYWDMALYIPSYVAFFVAAGCFLVVHKAGWWRALGYAAIALALVCAIFDYLEDFAILHGIESYSKHALSDPDAERILRWGRCKWGALYAAVLFLSPLPLGFWRSQLLRFAGLIVAIYAVLSGASGLIGAVLGNPVRISSSTPGLSGLVLFFFPLYALAHNGLVDGMDRLASFRAFSWLASWTEYGKHPIIVSDLVPERLAQTRVGQVRQRMASELSASVISDRDVSVSGEPKAPNSCGEQPE